MYLVQKLLLLHNTGPSSVRFSVEILHQDFTRQNRTGNEHLSSLDARRILKAIPGDLGYVFDLLPFFKCRTSRQWNLILIYPQPWPCSRAELPSSRQAAHAGASPYAGCCEPPILVPFCKKTFLQ